LDRIVAEVGRLTQAGTGKLYLFEHSLFEHSGGAMARRP
jgi:hypothetical protein